MSGMDRLTELLSRASECFKHHGVAGGLAADIDDALTDHRRASQAAPAPSDGLREALDRIAEQQMYRSGYDQTDISVEPVLTASEMQEIARAALSASPAQEGEPRHD